MPTESTDDILYEVRLFCEQQLADLRALGLFAGSKDTKIEAYKRVMNLLNENVQKDSAYMWRLYDLLLSAASIHRFSIFGVGEGNPTSLTALMNTELLNKIHAAAIEEVVPTQCDTTESPRITAPACGGAGAAVARRASLVVSATLEGLSAEAGAVVGQDIAAASATDASLHRLTSRVAAMENMDLVGLSMYFLEVLIGIREILRKFEGRVSEDLEVAKSDLQTFITQLNKGTTSLKPIEKEVLKLLKRNLLAIEKATARYNQIDDVLHSSLRGYNEIAKKIIKHYNTMRDDRMNQLELPGSLRSAITELRRYSQSRPGIITEALRELLNEHDFRSVLHTLRAFGVVEPGAMLEELRALGVTHSLDVDYALATIGILDPEARRQIIIRAQGPLPQTAAFLSQSISQSVNVSSTSEGKVA